MNHNSVQTYGESKALFHVFVDAEPVVVISFTPRSLYSQATSDSVLVIVALYLVILCVFND